MAWTAASTPMAFLALDRNGDGRVNDGAELFGDSTPFDGRLAANGFEALRALDLNHDGIIDTSDAAWSQLLLWIDMDHNGLCGDDEVRWIGDSDVTSLDLTYHWTFRHDPSGNTLRYMALLHRGARAEPYYDVFFSRQ